MRAPTTEHAETTTVGELKEFLSGFGDEDLVYLQIGSLIPLDKLVKDEIDGTVDSCACLVNSELDSDFEEKAIEEQEG